MAKGNQFHLLTEKAKNILHDYIEAEISEAKKPNIHNQVHLFYTNPDTKSKRTH